MGLRIDALVVRQKGEGYHSRFQEHGNDAML